MTAVVDPIDMENSVTGEIRETNSFELKRRQELKNAEAHNQSMMSEMEN